MSFRVFDIRAGEDVPGVPSPLLIEQGGGVAVYEAPSDPNGPWKGMWFLQDAHHPIGTDGTVRRVKVIHTEEWKVTVAITIYDPSLTDEDQEPEYSDWFIVEASDRADAETRGRAAARKDVEDRYGDDVTVQAYVQHSRPGGLGS